MKTELHKLIGSQIVSIHGDHIMFSRDGKVFSLQFETDDGDCCGFAHISANMFLEENSDRNPIITDVTMETEREPCDEDRCTIVFYGEQQQIANIEANAGSGSGWMYGASASIVCSTLDINEMLVMW